MFVPSKRENVTMTDGCDLCLCFLDLCRLLLSLMTTGALVFSVLTITSCKFADPYSFANPASVGLYREFDASHDKCKHYTDGIDYFLRVSRASSILATTFGTLALLLATSEVLYGRVCCYRLLMSTNYILAEIFQGTTFLFFKSKAW